MSETHHTPGELYGTLIRLAVPIMLANLLQMLYNLADAYFLGKLGKEAVSAPTISFNLVMLLVVFGMGLAMAGTTLIAQSKGKGDRERVDFYLAQITMLLAATSVVISAAGLLLARPILMALQVPEAAFAPTYTYLTIIFAGLPLMFIFFIAQSAMQGIGDSMTPLIIQAATVVINVLLDPAFIFGFGFIPALGVAGAAYATIISRAFASVVAVLILLRGNRGLQYHRRHFRPDRKAMGLLFRIGMPASIGQGLSALGFTVLQGIVNGFGTAVVAAFGVGNRITGLFNMPAMGFSRATASLVGQRLGARRPDQAKTVVKQSVLTVFVFITIGMTLTFFFGNRVVRFFIDDPEVIRHGALMFRIISVSVIPFAMFMVTNGAFQGGGDTKPVMYLNVMRLWGLRVPIAAILAYWVGIGPPSIWIAMFISNIVTATVGFAILRQGRWLTKINPDEI